MSMTTTEVSPSEQTVIPAVFEHAQRVYEGMVAKAAPDGDLLVYDGHLTALFRQLRLSVPYYTLIRRKLVAMGCIEQVRRGGGTATSRWVLWKAPELDEWKGTVSVRAERGNETSQLRQQVKVLHDRVTSLEEQMMRMVAALRLGDKT